MSEALVSGHRMDEVVATVGRARDRLVDPWEATAVVESLGYTDARVSREFGLPDTHALGAYVFERLAGRPPAAVARRVTVAEDASSSRPAADLLDSLAFSLVYAVPWLSIFLLERFRPEALRLPGHASVPLSLALMLSLIVSGGFIQAISRLGRFYLGMNQPVLAAWLCGYLFRVGSAVAVALAIVGVGLGWTFGLSSWPYLALTADEFVVLTVLWMSCGVITVRGQRWRVPIAFATGAAAFAACRLAAEDALIAQLVASAVVLVTSLAQMPSAFALPKGEEAVTVPLPRVTVLLHRVLPYCCYGALYFCFLFAGRFGAGASVPGLNGAPVAARPASTLGLDIALITFLFASAAIEYANIRFSRLVERVTHDEYGGDPQTPRAKIGRLHRRALAIVVCGFVPTAFLMGWIMSRILQGAARAVWTTLAVADAGYLLLAVGSLNALVLFGLNRSWVAVKALAVALTIHIIVDYLAPHTLNAQIPAAGLMVGAAWLVVQTSAAVRAAFQRVDYAIAAAPASPRTGPR